MPLRGKRPIIAPIFIRVCVLSHTRIPITNNLEKSSGAFSTIFFKRINNAMKIPNSKRDPINPNSSPYMANIESFAASGKYPVACTLLPKPNPTIPPDPIAIKAWHA